MAKYRPTCTACGATGNQISDGNSQLKKLPHATRVTGKCPNTKDEKHVLQWQLQ